jgi:DNA repair exonuclease SbcCD nuclease subunit
MSKALIFSDLHLHAHKDRIDRLQDCVKTLEWIFETAKSHNCRYIFFLGDLFHERSKIDVLNYLKAFEVFMKYAYKKIDVYLLVGNHDMYHKEKWDVNSIKPFTAIQNVHIIEKPKALKFDDCLIDWLPHTENPIKELADLAQQHNGAGDVLLAHIAINGAMTNTFYGVKSDVITEYDNEMMPVDIGILKDYKRVFLGHYHGAQNLNSKVEYIGSPLQLSFGEAFQQKHVAILDLETLERKYVVNEFSPKHLIVTPTDVENEAYELSGNFVRLSVDDVGSKSILDLKRQIASSSSPLSLDIKETDSKKTQEVSHAMLNEAQNVLTNIADVLTTYMKERGIPEGLDQNKLFAIGKGCLNEKS